MSIPHSLLALLAREPAHGYGLKTTFEASTAGAWPLNVGQVYTTLARLERDGLVEASPSDDASRPTWNITASGRDALGAWYASPVDAGPSRDEVAIKVLLAVAASSVDVREVLQRQRVATVRRLQEYTRHKSRADPDRDLAWVLLLDSFILKAEAEVKWLDLCEARLSEAGA
jgi:DNA-binding PadR family transcriptional regulator